MTDENCELLKTTYGQRDFFSFELDEREKKRPKFIKRVEKIVRTSFEMKNYTNCLKENFNLRHCSLLSSLTKEELSGIDIELHHYPLTLYDICEIILIKIETLKTCLTPLTIAEEVVYMHYKNFIGLVPLSRTMHEAVHDGQLFLNPSHIFGDWKEFINLYKEFIPSHIKEKLLAVMTICENADKIEDINKRFLEINPLISEDFISLQNLLEFKKE